MKKAGSSQRRAELSDIRPEYDFRGGLRGKHAHAYRQGHTVRVHRADGTTVIHYFTLKDGAVMLEPDVQEYFPNSRTVNEALRSLITLIPTKRSRGVKRS